jgi:hypothetical protein
MAKIRYYAPVRSDNEAPARGGSGTAFACYAHLGRLDDARAMVSGLRAITPLVVSSNLPWRNPEDCKLYLSGVRLAMDEAT